MVETGNDGGPLRRRVIALEERMHLEAGLRAAQGAELTALGVVQRGLLGTVQSLRETQLEHGGVLTDHIRRFEDLDAQVDNVDLHVEELDLKGERILEILQPGG